MMDALEAQLKKQDPNTEFSADQRCKDVRVLGEFEGGEDLPSEKGIIDKWDWFRVPSFGPNSNRAHTKEKGEIWQLEHSC